MFKNNVLRLGEGCLTDAQFSHIFQWQLLPNRCYKLAAVGWHKTKIEALNKRIKKRKGWK